MPRNAFRLGLELISQTQKELRHPPERSKINKLVKSIVHDAGLEEDKRRRSFTLLATCALLGIESMHNNYAPRRRSHGSS